MSAAVGKQGIHAAVRTTGCFSAVDPLGDIGSREDSAAVEASAVFGVFDELPVVLAEMMSVEDIVQTVRVFFRCRDPCGQLTLVGGFVSGIEIQSRNKI